MPNPFDAVEFAPACPPINPSVRFYSLCDEAEGGISATPYHWWHTVALPFAVNYVEALNRMAGWERYSVKANY